MTLPLPARPAVAAARRLLDPWRAVAFASLLAALAPNPASAVGLGPITQQSALGQSLRVVVPVTLGPDEDLAPECFKIAAAERDADGIPQLLFGRVNVERSPSGTALVITNARTVSDPIVRLTIQAGCEATIRREYTLFMDPPAIEAPVVAAETAPREAVVAPPPAPVTREARRPAAPRARTSSRTAQAPGSADGAEAKGKPAPQKGRAVAKGAPKRPPAVATERPRLSLSSGAPGTAAGGGATVADRERAQREQAAAIEAETQVLQQRIVELTALVERMQQELRAQEQAEQEAAAAQAAAPQGPAASAPAEPAKTVSPTAAKAPPPAPATDWWGDNAVLIAGIVLLPLLIAGVLLWKRRRGGADDDQWRTGRTETPRAEGAPESSASVLRNPTAGLASATRDLATTVVGKEPDRIAPADAAIDALAVSELSHVTEEARVFVALGHPERAIEVLQDHIRRLPRSMPAAWLMLLGLHHAGGNRPEFRALAEDFHVQFNVRTPLWEGFATDESGAGGLEGFPHVQKQVVELWRKPGCRAYLERLLYDNREGRRNGFPLTTYGEILLLLQILDMPEDIDIDMDLIDFGGSGAAPAPESRPAPAPRQTRRPMPPDPAASRPAQQPIRFDIDPTDTRGKPKS